MTMATTITTTAIKATSAIIQIQSLDIIEGDVEVAVGLETEAVVAVDAVGVAVFIVVAHSVVLDNAV